VTQESAFISGGWVPPLSSQVSQHAVIEPGAEIGDGCQIGPFCHLGPHVRIDLGRPLLIFLGVALLSIYLVADVKKASLDAFKKRYEAGVSGITEKANRAAKEEELANITYERATEELKKTLAKQAAQPEMEELIDEITGKPLQAIDSAAHEPATGQQPSDKASPGLTSDDKQ
jgi:hypothetical protein